MTLHQKDHVHSAQDRPFFLYSLASLLKRISFFFNTTFSIECMNKKHISWKKNIVSAIYV